MRALMFAFTLCICGIPMWAETVEDDDQRYRDLKRDWLTGNEDLDTLRKLAALSGVGNLAAQVLLGMIYRQPQTYHHVLAGLPSGEHRAIFRKPNGRFGERWLKVAAPSSALAALLTQTEIEDYEGYAMALADAGVTKTAIDYANLLINKSDHLGTIRALSHPNLLPYTKVSLHWYAETMEAGLRLGNEHKEADEIMKLRIKLPYPDFKERLLAFEVADYIRFDELSQKSDALRLRGSVLLHHPDLKPLVDIMQEVCPEDTAYHMGVLFHLSGDTSLQLTLLSPFEPIISTDDWQQSGRFRGDLLRNWYDGHPRFEDLQNLSDCFAAAVMAQVEPQ